MIFLKIRKILIDLSSNQDTCISTLRMLPLVSQASLYEIPPPEPLPPLIIRARPLSIPDTRAATGACHRERLNAEAVACFRERLNTMAASRAEAIACFRERVSATTAAYANSDSLALNTAVAYTSAIARAAHAAVADARAADADDDLLHKLTCDAVGADADAARAEAILADAARANAVARVAAAILGVARSDDSIDALKTAIADATSGDDAVNAAALADAVAMAAINAAALANATIEVGVDYKIDSLKDAVDDNAIVSVMAKLLAIESVKVELFRLMSDAYAACHAVIAMCESLGSPSPIHTVYSWIANDARVAGKACADAIIDIDVKLNNLLLL